MFPGTDSSAPVVLGDMSERTLDVREVEGEPFGEIVAALDDLPADESLVLLNEFEPRPLYAVLESRGFDHEAEQVDDVWRVRIEHA